MNTNIGMAGEFRCVVKKSDGSIKTDTGYQKNLILDQGLDFFGGGGEGYSMMQFCVIGSGNSQPNYTQNKLDMTVTGASGTESSTKYDYNEALDGNLYKTNRVFTYSFTGLNNVNISELGLASTYGDATTYFLCTRALIKDSQGNPTTITVLSGEILEIYYKLWAVYDTTDKTGTINLLDGVGGSTPYNYVLRMAGVGGANIGGSANYGSVIGLLLRAGAGNSSPVTYSGELGTVKEIPINSLQYVNGGYMQEYQPTSNKRTAVWDFDINTTNGAIRSFLFFTSMGFYQIRFGSVADDSPIVKTDTQTLTIPVEVSWGRYEGAL